MLAWLRTYIDRHDTMPFVPGWAHLWFLFYLMLFTVLVWIASALELRRIGVWETPDGDVQTSLLLSAHETNLPGKGADAAAHEKEMFPAGMPSGFTRPLVVRREIESVDAPLWATTEPAASKT